MREIAHCWTRPLNLLLLLILAYAPVAFSQSYPPPPKPIFAQQELDQMLAPIALYPDSLLSQILMAATYPLEVVAAARWSRAYPNLQGDAAVRAVEEQDWDPSVKSLVAFPQILSMMDEKLDWMQRLGDAFLAQEPQVMDTVQSLRQRAYVAGNLRSTNQIRVEPQGQIIVIQPANPYVIYVPYYDPLMVYGSWWWPEPPVYWRPWPGYVRSGISTGFLWGGGIGVSANFFFGAFDWPRHQARVINVNNYYYNHNRTVISNRSTIVRNPSQGLGVWQHDPSRRRDAVVRATVNPSPNAGVPLESARRLPQDRTQRGERTEPSAVRDERRDINNRPRGVTGPTSEVGNGGNERSGMRTRAPDFARERDQRSNSSESHLSGPVAVIRPDNAGSVSKSIVQRPADGPTLERRPQPSAVPGERTEMRSRAWRQGAVEPATTLASRANVPASTSISRSSGESGIESRGQFRSQRGGNPDSTSK